MMTLPCTATASRMTRASSALRSPGAACTRLPYVDSVTCYAYNTEKVDGAKPSEQAVTDRLALMRHAMRVVSKRGHAAVLLVGEPAYYGRFGFSAEKTGKLWLPGLADRSRLLGHEFGAGSLDGARGSIRTPKKPSRSRLLDAVAGLVTSPQPQAA